MHHRGEGGGKGGGEGGGEGGGSPAPDRIAPMTRSSRGSCATSAADGGSAYSKYLVFYLEKIQHKTVLKAACVLDADMYMWI